MNEHNYVMVCSHVTKNNAEAISENFPDLLCKLCSETMANSEGVPDEVFLSCRNCILKQLTKR